MNAEEPNDDYDAQAAEAARKANIEELNAVMPQALEERVRVLEEALRVRGKCFHCQGTGKPNCVTCDDYQACRCRPGEGRYAKHCWNCKGTGLNAWAAALLSPAAATEGGEGA